jgi:Ca2+-binding RTX toxin-like protein
MARLNIITSFPGIALPLSAWPALDRLGGATATSAVFEILDGPLAGGRLLLGGSGFAYDGQEMPAAGTVTSLTLQRPGDFATIGVLDGFSTAAATLRAAGDLQALLLAGADTLTGGAGGDRLVAGEGNDLLEGGEGADRLEGGGGRDTLRGGNGADVLLAGGGNDLILPGLGRDVVRAGAGDDTIRFTEEEEAGAGELLDGGAGFDTLAIAAAGHDMLMLAYAQVIGIEAIRFENTTRISLTPGQLLGIEEIALDWDPAAEGKDWVALEIWGDGHVVLDGFDLSATNGTRLLVELFGDVTLYGRNAANGLADDWVLGSGESDVMWLGEGNDSVLSGSGNDTLRGEDGDDTLDGGLDADIIFGGSGTDMLVGGAGNDTLWAEDGADTLDGGADDDDLYAADGADSLSGGAGNDGLDGGAGADTMVGGVGDDSYAVDHAGDVVVESSHSLAGRDVVVASISWTLGAGLEELVVVGDVGVAGAGNSLANRISGALGADTLGGGGGADTLTGSAGADELTGGAGADRFRFRSASESGVAPGTRDVIKDFNRAQGDRIDLSEVDALSGPSNDAFTSLAQYSMAETPAAGSLRWLQSGATTVVFGYVDSVAGADFAIEVMGMGAAQVADFIM